MYSTTINATKTARQLQLYRPFVISCKSENAQRALFHKVICNWLTTTNNSAVRTSSTTTFYQNNFLRKRTESVSIVTNRSFVTYCLTNSVADKSHEAVSSQLLSSSQNIANVRHFIGKNFSTVNCGTIFRDSKMDKSNEFQRLPSSVVPKHYNLELNPDLIGFTFAGNVSIKVQVK